MSELLDANPPASEIVFVSAFVSLQTIMRIKHQVINLKENPSVPLPVFCTERDKVGPGMGIIKMG